MASSGAKPLLVGDFSIFKPVRAATTAALTASYTNGASGVGAKLTGSGALPAQDGITLVLLDRLLVKNQAAALQNGIYILTTLNPFELTRSPDCDISSELESGGVVFVVSGTLLSDTDWIIHAAAIPAVMGTTGITWDQVGSTGVTLPILESDVTNLTTDLTAKAPTANPTFTGAATFTQQPTTTLAMGVTGLTGANAVTSRYVGSTVSGSPTSGTFQVGDWIVDQTGKFWMCTAFISTPGTWVQLSGTAGSAGIGSAAPSFSKAGTVVVVQGKQRWTAPNTLTIDSVIVSLDTAPVGANLIIDVRKGTPPGAATTIFTTTANRPTVLDGTYEVRSVAPNITGMVSGDYLLVDVIQVGSSTPGSDMTVQIIFT